jgi:hypothetical protein
VNNHDELDLNRFVYRVLTMMMGVDARADVHIYVCAMHKSPHAYLATSIRVPTSQWPALLKHAGKNHAACVTIIIVADS